VARVAGLGSFVGVSIGVLLGLRLFHVAVPFFFAETRPGPFAAADLDEAARLAGFAPLVPGYRPEVLGERLPSVVVARAPRPTIEIEWRGERYLTIIEQKGGSAPEHPATAPPLADFPGSAWWEDGPSRHLIVQRGDVWVHVETDLPSRDLERIADTLRPW
jgi:hypothetical protein